MGESLFLGSIIQTAPLLTLRASYPKEFVRIPMSASQPMLVRRRLKFEKLNKLKHLGMTKVKVKPPPRDSKPL
jgi:hypothetical protein